MLQINKYNVDIYGDGLKEYEGFYMVVIVEFDENNKQLEQKTFYFKSESLRLLEDYIKENVDDIFQYRNNAKWQLEARILAHRINK